MPSPVGHALAGFAVGWLLMPSSRLARPLVAAATFGLLAVIPDADLLMGHTHRMYTHSIGAVGIVGLIAIVAVQALPGLTPRDRLLLALAATAAYGTHVLLDWLGNDGSEPLGIRALWPFSDGFYESDLHVFPPVERRYWLPIFWTRNLRALATELIVVAPFAAFAWWVRRAVATGRPPRAAQR